MKALLKFAFLLFTFVSISIADGVAGIAAVSGTQPITVSDAMADLEGKKTLFCGILDAQTKKEIGYIPNSVFVDSKNWRSALPKDKNVKVIFYGKNRMSFEPAELSLLAKSAGYNNTFILTEGIEGWILNGGKSIKTGLEEWNTSPNILDYKDSIHAEMVFGKIPACSDCHSEEKGSINPNLATNKNLISLNCAKCHEKAQQHLQESAHAPKKAKLSFANLINVDLTNDKGKNLPNCLDCHGVHQKNEAYNLANPRTIAEISCEKCHEGKMKTFLNSFHGKALLLSKNNVADFEQLPTCASCHGKHNILPTDNRNSTLYGEAKINTCAKCHEGASLNFTEFKAHADHHDADKFPLLNGVFKFMMGLVIAVFVFFGVHTLLWCIRLLWLKLSHPDEWKAAKEKSKADKVHIKRFTLFQKVQHFFMAASFLGLSVSGLGQKFYDAAWAQSLIDLLGGPLMATQIHHFSAVIMFIVFFSHIGQIISCKVKSGWTLKDFFGPDGLMPNWQDFKDLAAHFKWFFGKGERPQFDRWTYWEKFDYLAVFWGMFMIGITGLMLWFPVGATALLGGEWLNVATVIHSDEALLAMGFIFAVHFFNTHFRADRFPMDMVIFSGSLSQSEVQHERSKWFDRLKKAGKLDELLIKGFDFPYATLSKVVGIAMLVTGLFFLVLMIVAGLSYL